jgi:predicted ribosomally synthesized peptide with nif11-like leader
MNENLKKFLEEASKNEELKAKLAALTDKDTAVAKAVELAKEYGFALTAEDFQPADGAELSLDELDSVAGGAWCFMIGGGSRCHCITNGAARDEQDTTQILFCEKCQSYFAFKKKGDLCPDCGTILIEK